MGIFQYNPDSYGKEKRSFFCHLNETQFELVVESVIAPINSLINNMMENNLELALHFLRLLDQVNQEEKDNKDNTTACYAFIDLSIKHEHQLKWLAIELDHLFQHCQGRFEGNLTLLKLDHIGGKLSLEQRSEVHKIIRDLLQGAIDAVQAELRKREESDQRLFKKPRLCEEAVPVTRSHPRGLK